MTIVFNRPAMIHETFSISLPTPGLDKSETSSEIPSPIVARILEYQLAAQLSNHSIASTSSTMLEYVKDWMALLPSTFSTHDPDKRWDSERPYLAFQRLELHCTGYMMLLMLLKPYLTAATGCSSSISSNESKDEAHLLVNFAIDTSLKLMAKCREFFDITWPEKAKYFLVSFFPFDTAALLCLVLQQDKEHKTPRRLEVAEAIGKGLYISSRLRSISKMGDATWGILMKLISRLELSFSEREILDTSGNYRELLQSATNTVDSASTTDVADMMDSRNTPSLLPEESFGSNLTLADDVGLGDISVGAFTPSFEFGFWDGPWDWEGSNINSS